VITITEKEKQYLLGVDGKQFIDKLYSKSLFYELLNEDYTHKTTTNEIRKQNTFNVISIIGLYNFIINVVNSEIQEALNLRHLKYSLNAIKTYKNLKIVEVIKDSNITFNIIPEDDCWSFSPNKYFQRDYNYTIGSNYPYNDHVYKIRDTLLLKNVLNIQHCFTLHIQEPSEFISKMLILYEDFVDNIPV
jgi:hypothetical protein